MEKLILAYTEDTPQVELNYEEKIFKISGKSLPENAVSFYLPILEWLKKYGTLHTDPIVFDFCLEYFNTASAKQITKLLLVLQELSEKFDVKVRWYYLREDTDILSSGLRFSRLLQLKIQMIAYDE